MNKTRLYYEEEADSFFKATVGIDPSPFLGGFEEALAPCSRVLDMGCGSGRDLLWLKGRGHRPVGVERSCELARLAQNHSGCPVYVGDLMTTELLDDSWDGILLSGVLVHSPHQEIPQALKRLAGALEKEGALYISVKEGEGERTDSDGRHFYFWQRPDFEREIAKAGLSVISMERSTSLRRKKDTWLGYLLSL